MAYTFFDKKTVGGVCKNEIMQNKELVEEHKPIIRKFEKRNAHSSFVDNIWGADLADMQLWSKFNEGFRFLLRVIDTYSLIVNMHGLSLQNIKRVLQLLILFKKC